MKKQRGGNAKTLLEARGSLEKVVEMTADHWRQKDDAKFEEAFAKLAC